MKNHIKRLYWLLEQYLKSKINARTFCDEIYYSYDLEIDAQDLSTNEQQIFSDLSIVVDRFSEYEIDRKKYPKTYFSENELKAKVREAKNNLDGSASA